MKTTAILTAALATALLSGCGAPGTSVSGMQKANVSFASGAPAPGLLGYQPTEIRVVEEDANAITINNFSEVTATCTLKGPGYTSRFQTPATVNLPNYGRASQPVALSCSDGSRVIERTMTPVNLSQRSRNAKASNIITGIVLLNPGSVVGGAVATVPVGQDGGDVFAYDNVKITLK